MKCPTCNSNLEFTSPHEVSCVGKNALTFDVVFAICENKCGYYQVAKNLDDLETSIIMDQIETNK